MIPQPVLTYHDIENEITEICKDKKKNQIRSERLKIQLEQMVNTRFYGNAYIGLAFVATMIDDDISAMKYYMNTLLSKEKSAMYFYNYAYFLFIFDELTEAKEKLLSALDYPVQSLEVFQKIAWFAVLLKDNEIDEKILSKCRLFSKTEEYSHIQMEVGEQPNLSLQHKFIPVELDELFS